MLQLSKKQRQELGDFLKNARVKSGLSQADVARKADLKSPQLISNIERGICSAPLYLLKKMQDLYSLNPWELVSMITSMHEEVLMQSFETKKKSSNG